MQNYNISVLIPDDLRELEALPCTFWWSHFHYDLLQNY